MKILTFLNDYFFTNILKKRIKPRVLQLPITGFCNSRCTTCNIWNMTNKKHINPDELKNVLLDVYFSKVSVVGVNGGEPSMHPQLEDVIESLFVLKKLKRIHVISNGMVSELLAEKLKKIKPLCESRGVSLYLTLSIDGIEEIHDKTRGVEGAYKKTLSTLKIILCNRKLYCDYVDIGCTISNSNIEAMPAVEVLCKKLGVTSYYHLAVPNERIGTYIDADYSVLNDKRNSLLAQEYFYGKFKYGDSFKSKFRCFVSYYYLKKQGKKRIVPCQYLRRDITIDENLNMFLCACASKKVGELVTNKPHEILKSGNIKKEEVRLKKLCNSCIHYIVYPSFKSLLLYFKEKYSGIIWLRYKLGVFLGF